MENIDEKKKLFSIEDVREAMSKADESGESDRMIREYVERQINKGKLEFYESQMGKLSKDLSERLKEDGIFKAKIDGLNETIQLIDKQVEALTKAIAASKVVNLVDVTKSLNKVNKTLNRQADTLESLNTILARVVKKLYPGFTV